MANLMEIKKQMIGMNPNDKDWEKWVKSQKIVENLITADGAIRPKEELEALFSKYRTKHQTISGEEQNLLNLIGNIKDITILVNIINKCQAQIEANTKAYIKDITILVNIINSCQAQIEANTKA